MRVFHTAILCHDLETTWSSVDEIKSLVLAYPVPYKPLRRVIMELPLAGSNFAQLIECLNKMNTMLLPSLRNPLADINDSEGLWVNSLMAVQRKRDYFYYARSPNKVGGQNHFTKPQAQV